MKIKVSHTAGYLVRHITDTGKNKRPNYLHIGEEMFFTEILAATVFHDEEIALKGMNIVKKSKYFADYDLKIEKISKRHIDEELSDMALRMAVHGVRNTVIEDFHAAGKLTNDEMMVFNKEVADNIYSFLQIMMKPEYETAKEMMYDEPFFYSANNWDTPKLSGFPEYFIKNNHKLPL